MTSAPPPSVSAASPPPAIRAIAPAWYRSPTETVVASLRLSLGAYPVAGVVQGPDGSLYGGTTDGGLQRGPCWNGYYLGCGAVFRVAPDGTVSDLHQFDGRDGYQVIGGVTMASDGMLYGTTNDSFVPSVHGTIFRVAPDGTQFATLHRFESDTRVDGFGSWGRLLEGRDGVLYGTTPYGGQTRGGSGDGYGTVFRICKDGRGFRVIHAFTGRDGANPEAGLIELPDGSLMGTTWGGGGTRNGTVFRLRRDGSRFQVVHVFTDGHAEHPGGLTLIGEHTVVGASGAATGDDAFFRMEIGGEEFLYVPTAGYVFSALTLVGTRLYGVAEGPRRGFVFSIGRGLDGLRTAYRFDGGPEDGARPAGQLLLSPIDGNLYGTTISGGEFRCTQSFGNCGTVFSLQP